MKNITKEKIGLSDHFEEKNDSKATTKCGNYYRDSDNQEMHSEIYWEVLFGKMSRDAKEIIFAVELTDRENE